MKGLAIRNHSVFIARSDCSISKLQTLESKSQPLKQLFLVIFDGRAIKIHILIIFVFARVDATARVEEVELSER